MKVAEARELEVELQKTRDENAELRRRVNEAASLETAKRKADARIEQLEQKVGSTDGTRCTYSRTPPVDGGDDSGEGHPKRERVECHVRRENAELRGTVGHVGCAHPSKSQAALMGS